MNDDLELSEAGMRLVQAFEGCLKKKGDHYHAYRCPANVLTIGWGHTNHHGRQFDEHARWTLAECDQAFMEDMDGFERDVRKAVTVPLKQWQFNALVSFTYNVGAGNLNKSTLLKKVNAGDFGSWHKDKGGTGAAAEFIKWNKANGKVLNGLTRRRASESMMFQNIPDLDYDGAPDSMPQEIDPPHDGA